ncbi:cytochrome c oxidase subunit I [Horticoccus luteus]|uniref:Cytochrome c oxidase subunit 1 n=1 Tax=Horticoccus luteus TaxID=2862869 RepID=A0A8F9TYQ7_9BACT|nr:cytochrome c oxidase subunit I [Horticoccus luteus]QYM79982.1 cytochrome c oxidase subunit I [Horticoccus luteus]
MDATVKSHFIGQDAGHAGTKGLVLWRPTAKTGLMSWLTTVDHKRIALLYGLFAIFFLFVGGTEALLIRLQLAVPNNTVLTAHQYNTMFTMHGTTMIFLAIMPLNSAFFNFIMPLQIGARDVAFPRLNAFSLWTFVAGAIILNLGWFMKDGAPDAGWFGYAPLTSKMYNPDHSIDMWVMGLQILGISSVAGSLNFIVTIINLRAPGMTMMRLPVFTWMTLITSFLIVLAFPAITIALVELMMDRLFATNFFEASNGGMPILWQHLFWVFGHPEVYILILPAFGMISEIMPTFSRKPLFGYPVVVFSGAAIGFLGFTVWSHHMFTTGMGTVATAAFALATMAIAVPTGVKIFNWIGTMWGGHIRMRLPMLFALGFIWMFMIGGFSGVMHAAAPADAQQQDSYFVIAHFHYVLIGGSLFAMLGGLCYWFPLVFGRQMSERWGRIAFWIIFAGFNVTFFPMHFLGLNGMPRRTFTYDGNLGWNTPNLISSCGAFFLGLGIAIFFITFVYGMLKGAKAPRDAWDARTLEWSLPNPVPEYNYAVIPTVHARDALWYQKHHADEIRQEEEAHAKEEDAHGGIHMPFQSFYPFVATVGIFIASWGIAVTDHSSNPAFWTPKVTVTIVGGAIMLLGFYLWSLEGADGYHIHVKEEKKSHS